MITRDTPTGNLHMFIFDLILHPSRILFIPYFLLSSRANSSWWTAIVLTRSDPRTGWKPAWHGKSHKSCTPKIRCIMLYPLRIPLKSLAFWWTNIWKMQGFRWCEKPVVYQGTQLHRSRLNCARRGNNHIRDPQLLVNWTGVSKNHPSAGCSSWIYHHFSWLRKKYTARLEVDHSENPGPFNFYSHSLLGKGMGWWLFQCDSHQQSHCGVPGALFQDSVC